MKSPGLGGLFLDAAERCERAIIEYPDACTIVRGEIRRRRVSRFPYALLYAATASELRILAVMNLKRRPTYWVGRK